LYEKPINIEIYRNDKAIGKIEIVKLFLFFLQLIWLDGNII